VIVESPAKAKTINKYLGSDYVVKSSVGHIRDLPTSGSAAKKSADSTSTKTAKKPKKDERGALVNRMGVDPWHNWEAHYEVLPGKEKVVSELKQLAEKADHIYLATDLDREGEAIRSEEHTSELQSRFDLVCRLLLEQKKNKHNNHRQLKR